MKSKEDPSGVCSKEQASANIARDQKWISFFENTV